MCKNEVMIKNDAKNKFTSKEMDKFEVKGWNEISHENITKRRQV
jgi:hypothetical protein